MMDSHLEEALARLHLADRREGSLVLNHAQVSALAGYLDSQQAEIKRLRAALERLRPILENAKDGFRNPPSYDDPSLTAYRLEGLTGGCRVGLEVIDKALGAVRG